MKWTIYILIGVMIASAVFADNGLIETYRPNEVFGLSIHLTNISGDVIGANCSTQIRNSTLNIITNLQNQEINGGYYNATFNTSKTGTYFCRQNCTLGTSYTSESCDFIIGGGNNLGVMIAIALIMIFVIVYYLYVAKTLTLEAFNKNAMIKIMFFLISLWMLLIPINFASYLSDTFIGSASLTSTITIMFIAVISLNILITTLFFLSILIIAVKSLQGVYRR